MNTPPLEKRKWIYLQRPSEYEIHGCECGNFDPDWSEYADHLWCQSCEKDFIPKHSGIFDGPIPIHSCALMGIYFDRFNLETGRVERYDIEGSGWISTVRTWGNPERLRVGTRREFDRSRALA